MIIGTSQQLAKVSINSLRVGTATVTSVSSARNQDSWFDSKLAMAIYISIYLKATPRLWFMPLFHADSITVTVFYMACRSINSISYSMCRACVQDQYAVKVNIVTLLLYQQDLHWLLVKFRIEFKILLIVFKIFTGLAPSYTYLISTSHSITHKPVSKYTLRSSSASTLLIYSNVKPKATLGERAFLFAAPKLWDAVPRFIRESISIDTLKRKLKTHLFKKAFCTTQKIRLYFQLTRL